MAKEKTIHDPDDFRMTFFEHLEELRKRLIHALIGIALGVIILVPLGKDLVGFLCVPLFRSLRDAGLEPRVIVLGAPAAFTIYMKVVIIGGIIVASPWVVYQVWKFIATGLYEHERKVVYIIMPLSAIMTTLGLLFMYFIMLPISLTFLINFAVDYGEPGGTGESPINWLTDIVKDFSGGKEKSDGNVIATTTPEQNTLVLPMYEADPAEPENGQVWFNATERQMKFFIDGDLLIGKFTVPSMLDPQLELGQFIGFVTFMTLGIVVGFQMPVILLIGGWTQVLDPRWLAKYRKYCVFICFVLGAMLTPADPISMVVLALPLWMLFEFGLLLGRLVYHGPDHPAAGAE